MNYPKQHNTNYNNISGNDSHLLGVITENDLAVFGIRELRSLSGWSGSRLHNTLHSLQVKGILRRIKRNLYTLDMDIGERLFEIATESVKPSYISFWTALSHHGLTEQQVMTVQLVSTIQDRKMMIDPYMVKVTRFKPERFFGYAQEDRYVMGNVEKVLVDSLFLPDRCGGIDEFTRCLKRAWDGIDRNRFARYLIRFGNRSVISRTGHLMDVLELEGGEVRSTLKRYRSSGYVKLVPGRGEVRGHDHVWNVIVNHEIAGGRI